MDQQLTQLSLQDGVNIETDLRLISGIVELGWTKGALQHAIEPGRVGVLSIGGRVHDNKGQPLVFYPGDRPAHHFFASRLWGIPGLGRVKQLVIEFAENPGTITVVLKRTLFGISQSPADPATVKVHVGFKLLGSDQPLAQTSGLG